MTIPCPAPPLVFLSRPAADRAAERQVQDERQHKPVWQDLRAALQGPPCRRGHVAVPLPARGWLLEFVSCHTSVLPHMLHSSSAARPRLSCTNPNDRPCVFPSPSPSPPAFFMLCLPCMLCPALFFFVGGTCWFYQWLRCQPCHSHRPGLPVSLRWDSKSL